MVDNTPPTKTTCSSSNSTAYKSRPGTSDAPGFHILYIPTYQLYIHHIVYVQNAIEIISLCLGMPILVLVVRTVYTDKEMNNAIS